MKLISDYKVFLDRKFILEFHDGAGTMEDVMAFKLKEAEDVNYSPNYDLLIDVRDTKINAVTDEIKDYIEFIKLHKGISGNRKLAILTNTPRHVVFFTLLSMFKTQLAQNLKIFSTIEAAILWLGEPISIEDANNCIMNFKSKTKSYG